jgi:predicted AAA+ superfamily ATPase
MSVPRRLRTLLRTRLAESPAVALLGPRQCGKTTLAQSLPGAYFDLEQEAERLRLDLEWDSRVAGRECLILDEAQAWPALFPRLRGAIDRDRKRTGRFLLLGSVAPSLMTQVAESLAGRLAVLELTPLLREEVPAARRADRWLMGGYPDGGVLGGDGFPRWQRDYVTLLAERDLPTWGLSAPPAVTKRLLRLLAAVHGQAWNASQLGQALGVSYHTVNRYVDWLEGAFLLRRLPPWHANIGKRLVKSPKVYWRDSGVLHALLNTPDMDTLLHQPWVGASWEGFVIEQILGALAAIGRPVEPYFFRTSDGHEIDLVLEFGSARWAIEVKLTSDPGPGDFARLEQAAAMIGATHRFLVAQVARSSGTATRGVTHLAGMVRRVVA